MTVKLPRKHQQSASLTIALWFRLKEDDVFSAVCNYWFLFKTFSVDRKSLQSLCAASVMRSLISWRRSQSIFSKQLRSWAEQTTGVITQAYTPLSLRIRCYESLLNEAAALWWGVKYQIVCFIQRAAEKGVAPRGELLYYLSAGHRHTEVKCDMWE